MDTIFVIMDTKKEIKLKKPGIFGVFSDRLKTVYIGTSTSVDLRVRKLKSDIKLGKIGRVLKWAQYVKGSELEVRVMMYCGEENISESMGQVFGSLPGGWTVVGSGLTTEQGQMGDNGAEDRIQDEAVPRETEEWEFRTRKDVVLYRKVEELLSLSQREGRRMIEGKIQEWLDQAKEQRL